MNATSRTLAVSLGIVLVTWTVFASLIQAQATNYVRAERCQPCHAEAYEAWNNSSHAMAQQNLLREHQEELRCLFCHATDAQRNLTGHRIENVQCEACHGPGGEHLRLAIHRKSGRRVGGLKPVSEKTCRNCHTQTRSPLLRSFEYAKALEIIRHW